MSKPETIILTRDTQYRFTLTWDISVDLTSSKINFKQVVPQRNLFLPGKWNVSVTKGDEGSVLFRLLLGTLPVGVFSSTGSASFDIARVDSNLQPHSLRSTRWTGPQPDFNPASKTSYDGYELSLFKEDPAVAELASGGAFKLTEQHACRVTLTIEHDYPKDASAALERQGKVLATRMSGLNLEQVPHNLRLFFPHAHANGAELWVKSSVLSKPSPYINTLLASGMAESSPRRSKRKRMGTRSSKAVEAPEPDEKDFDSPKLFDDASVCYEEIRTVVLDFVEKNWHEVKKSEGWKEASARFEADEISGGETVMMCLWKRGVKL
ncbi:hypothetical protein JCM8547_002361 [Rhodosporidiobolus lusitaniae]